MAEDSILQATQIPMDHDEYKESIRVDDEMTT